MKEMVFLKSEIKPSGFYMNLVMTQELLSFLEEFFEVERAINQL